jgi:arylsulfatase A-like enzyme
MKGKPILPLLALVPALAFGQNARQPNVLLILSDDQGYRDLGCYGSPDIVTPNIDAIAQSGVRFTQFYAGAPTSSPSRASLLTGLSCLEAGVTGNVPAGKMSESMGLPAERETIAENLRANGYRTALVGKWHLGTGPLAPTEQGFDESFGFLGGCIDNYSHFFYWSGPNVHDLYHNGQEVYYPGTYFPDMVAGRVCDLLKEQHDDPLFIYCALNVPHYPYQGDLKWLEYYKSRGAVSPRLEYMAFVSSMDERVGRIIDELKASGEYDDTIIIFQADQGYSVEERAMFGGGDAGELRGCKFSLFEGGIRVPAIISYPRMLPQDKSIDNMSFAVDWYNTIAELTGSEISETSSGRSLVPLITGKTSGHTETMNWQVERRNDATAQWAVRHGPWKLIANVKDPRSGDTLTEEDKKFFLVNLDEDPAESKNLTNEHPDKVAELKAIHDRWYERAIGK